MSECTVDAAFEARPGAADDEVVRQGGHGIEQEIPAQIASGDERGVYDGGDGVGGGGGAFFMGGGEAEGHVHPPDDVAEEEERVREDGV